MTQVPDRHSESLQSPDGQSAVVTQATPPHGSTGNVLHRPSALSQKSKVQAAPSLQIFQAPVHTPAEHAGMKQGGSTGQSALVRHDAPPQVGSTA